MKGDFVRLFIAPSRSLLALLLILLSSPAPAQNELKTYTAKNGALSFSAPAAFQSIADVSPSAIVAIEVASFGVSFLATREKAEELEQEMFMPELKKRLLEGGAKVLGSAAAKIDGMPAYSFIVGGVKPGRESLFVYNIRKDFWYVFILNYPQGQRKDASDLWKLIGPSIKFK